MSNRVTQYLTIDELIGGAAALPPPEGALTAREVARLNDLGVSQLHPLRLTFTRPELRRLLRRQLRDMKARRVVLSGDDPELELLQAAAKQTRALLTWLAESDDERPAMVGLFPTAGLVID